MDARPVTLPSQLSSTAWRPLALVCLLGGLVTGAFALRGGFVDIAVYRYGADAIVHGIDLYGPRDGLPFTYPPFAALLFTVTLPLPFALLVAVWTALSLAALGFALFLFTDLAGWRLAGLTAAALAFEPVWSNLSFAQINLFLMAAIAYDLLRADRPATGWSAHGWNRAGWLIGVAAGIKLTPLLFVVFLVLVGRRSAAVTAMVSFLATVAAGFVLLPRSSWAYWSEVLWDPNRVGGVAYAGNQSMLGFLTREIGHQPPTWVWFLVAGSVALALLVLAASYWSEDRGLSVCLAAAAMLVASPISWNHHFVWAVPLAWCLVRRSRVAAVGLTLVFCSTVIWWPPAADDREVLWNAGQQVIGNAYLLALLLVCAYLAIVRRPAITAPDRSGAATMVAS
jgi:alpha-1,2-mannosyltransferase